MVKILIAEDSNVDAKYIESILSDKEYNLVFAKMVKKQRIYSSRKNLIS